MSGIPPQGRPVGTPSANRSPKWTLVEQRGPCACPGTEGSSLSPLEHKDTVVESGSERIMPLSLVPVICVFDAKSPLRHDREEAGGKEVGKEGRVKPGGFSFTREGLFGKVSTLSVAAAGLCSVCPTKHSGLTPQDRLLAAAGHCLAL